MDRYSYIDKLLDVMLLHPKQKEIQKFCLHFLSIHDPQR